MLHISSRIGSPARVVRVLVRPFLSQLQPVCSTIEKRAQEGLRQNRRQEPIIEHRATAERDRSQPRRIDQQLQGHRQANRAPRAFRNKRQPTSTAQGEGGVIDRSAAPEVDAGNLLEILPATGRLRVDQLRVARRVLRVTVMPSVKITVEGRIVEDSVRRRSSRPGRWRRVRQRRSGARIRALARTS